MLLLQPYHTKAGPSAAPPGGVGSKDPEETDDERWQRRSKDAGRILALALPLLLQYSIGHLSHMIDTAFVGHLDDPVMLSAMVLGGSFSMAAGYSIISGLASASETLSGQAVGARDHTALAATLLRSTAVCTLACVPISVVWANADVLLSVLGQPPDIAAGAARYLLLTLPALYLHSVHECMGRFLLAQGIVAPGVVISAITAAVTPVFCYVLVYKLEMQLDGAAYAYVATQATQTLLTLAYVGWRERQLTAAAAAGSGSGGGSGGSTAVPRKGGLASLPAFRAAVFERWGPYLALALPATLMFVVESWAMEVLVLLAGMLENAQVAVGAMGVCLQFSTLVWLAAASVGSSTATLIANALGEGNALRASRIAYTSLALVLVSQSSIGMAAYAFRQPLVQLLTANAETVHLAMDMMPVLACCFVGDGLNVVFGAVWRGTGRQWWGAALNLVGWWGVGVPLAVVLSQHMGLNVHGLWGAFAFASALQAAVQWAVLRRLDWNVEVKRARSMVASRQETELTGALGQVPGLVKMSTALPASQIMAGISPKAGPLASSGISLSQYTSRRPPVRYLPMSFPKARTQELVEMKGEGDVTRLLRHHKRELR
ncbi:MAG: hypothetical protein WDW36_006684 [Sanguina aurantia]